MSKKPIHGKFINRIWELEEGKFPRQESKEALMVLMHFLKRWMRIESAFQQETDIEQIILGVLQTMIEVFKCDRVWLLYPCDPEAKSWYVPIECARPEYPSAFTFGEKIPMTPDIANVIHKVLDKDDVVIVDARKHDAPWKTNKLFSTLTEINMAVYPKPGQPWMFGVHQCSHYRVWTDEEKDLFREIGYRVENFLSILLCRRHLRESEEKYKSLINNINVGIYRNTAGSTGKFIEANPAIVEMFSFDSKEEFLKVRVSDLYKNLDDREEYNAKILKEGAVKNLELQLRKKDGTSFCGSISAVVVRDRKGAPKYYDGIIEDITDRRRTEAELIESEEKYRSIMEAMDDAIYICSSDFCIEYMNPAMIKRIGREATGESCYRVMHGLDGKCPWCIHEKVMRGEHISYEVVSPKDGKSYHISNSPMFYLDKSISKLTVFRDVTEFNQMEVLLQQAQKMEAIGTLAGGIAHDFNNILFPLVGYAEMLKKDLSADSMLQCKVNEILRAALRAKDLVKQILSFSHQSDQDIKPIKLQTIINEAMGLIRSSIPTTIDIQQDIDPGCDVVCADPTQIHQVVMNLATNAYHAMEETGGRLNVTLKQVRMEPDQSLSPGLGSGEYAALTVTDTGIGIEKDVMDKIFDPYFTTKETGKGTGLGLSVVRRIVKNFNGDILINSEPGNGTEIQVYLPVMDCKVDDIRTDRSKPFQGGSERILLVDDEVAIIMMEQQMIERLGYQVTTRTGSVDALEAFKAKPDSFDLVITDMTMPNMTGIQLAMKIKKIRPNIPIILCTGYSYQVNDNNSKALGVQGFVMKPVIAREIDEVIRKVLDDSEED